MPNSFARFHIVLPCIALACCIASQAAADVTTGIVGHWKLNETSGTTASDSSGNANNGTYTGGPTLGAAAPCYLGVNFPANGRYVIAPASATLNAVGVSNANFSVAFWVKPNGTTGGWRPLLHKGAVDTQRGPGLWLNPGNNRLHFRVSTTSNYNEGTDSVANLPTGSWSHIACVKEGNKWRCYVNGVFDREVTLSAGTTGNSGPLYVGDDPWYSGSNAQLDDVRIYNRALIAADVAELYSPRLHWKLNETSGMTAADSSTCENTGTVTGTASWISAIRNNGFDLNGSTKIQANSELGNPANVSMAAWVDVDALDTSGSDIISIGDHVILRLTSTSVQAILYNGSSWSTTSTSFTSVGTGWHHYAFTFDDAANQLRIYIDGALATTATVTSTISYSGLGTATVIGQHGNSSTSNDLDGRVDDVRVYNYALTQAEIAVVYGFVAHYKLNETSGTTATDSSLSANSGTVTGTATWAAAVRGNGFDFNGASYIQATGLCSNPQDLTIATWARIDAVDSAGSEIVSLGDHALLRVTSTQVEAHIYTGSTWVTTSASYSLVGTGWHHLACTFDDTANQMKIYVDGVLLITGSVTSSISYSGLGSNILIGKQGNGGTSWDLDGRLDDVRIYNRALTAQEIATLSGTAGHWKLEESTGTTASDSSGSANHGTFVSAPTLGQTGVYDLATRFNNVTLTEYLSLPRAAVHDTSTVSASFWVKTTYTGEQSIVSGSSASQSNEYLLFFGSHTEFRIYCHGSTQSWTIPSIADGNWHHVVVVSTADTNTTVMYLDKVSMGSKSISAGSTPFSIASGGLIVAQEQDTVGGGFATSQCLRGTLDELRLYQRALTSKEIGELFGLVGHWAFTEGAGTTISDSSGAGLNATVNGASWTSDCAGNTALDFDGINDTAATTSTFDPPNEGTIAFWFRSAGPPAARQRLWGLNTDFEMWQDPDGLISCDVSTDGFQGGFITTTPLDTADQWYHLVAQYDADTDAYSIYIDGELHKTGVSTWAVSNQTAGTLTFGTRTGTADYFEGSIRDFRIYNRPMFNSEIAMLAGMIARWQLNESSGTVATDLSIAGNNVTYVGSPTLGVSGSNATTNGTAVELNGTSQYLTAGKSLLNGLTKFSLAAWVRPDSLTPDKSFLGQNGLIELGIDTQTDQIDLWTSNGGSLNATAQLALSKWSHVVAVGEGTVLRIYVNGVEVGSGGSAAASYGSNSGTFKIGEGVLSSSGTYFDGRFDDVRVYSRALCPEEVSAIYQGGRPAGVRIIRWVETR